MLVSVVVLYLLSGLCRLLDFNVEGLNFRLSAISYLGHLTLCTLYVVYTRRNIIQSDVKYYITSSVVYLYGWLIIALMEEVIFQVEHPGNRVLWYMQYIPMLMIPNLLLFAALYLNKPSSHSIPKRWWVTFVVTFLIIIGIMTNDLHGMAFRFIDGPNSFYRGHGFNTLFYIAMAWLFSLYFICAMILLKKAQLRKHTSYIWVVFIALGIAILYFGWWMGGRRHFEWLGDMYSIPQVVEAFILFTTEICMRFGLITANSNYREFFEGSQLSVSLVDADGAVRYKTAGQIDFSRSEMNKAVEEDVYIDEDHRLHGQKVSGGYAFWVNDLSSINRVAKKLRQVQTELEEENNLIAAENDMIARRVKADEQNKLYTMLAQQMQPQLNRIEEIVQNLQPSDSDFEEKLAQASVYKVYIKRACNLMLLGQNESRLHGFELENSIRESLEYLQLNGIECGYFSNANGRFAADDLLRTYNFFQEIIEDNMSSMKKIFVNLAVDTDRIKLKMKIDGQVFDKEIVAPKREEVQHDS